MYDLDKTQEWLNRTMQLGKTPAVRGGRTDEPGARKHTAMSVTTAALVIALGVLLISWTGMGYRAGVGANVVDVAGSARVADAPAAVRPASAASPVYSWPSAPRRAAPPVSSSWMPLSLDGDIVPLPGHTAPPAPVWLDGAPRARR